MMTRFKVSLLTLASALALLSCRPSAAQVSVVDLRDMTGPWECVSPDGVHGIFLEYSRPALGRQNTSIYVYARLRNKREGGYFDIGSDNNASRLLGNRLTIHFGIDLDVEFDPVRHRWTGSWFSCAGSKGILLERPQSSPGAVVSDFVGDWQEHGVYAAPDYRGQQRQSHDIGSSVMHVRQSFDGVLMAWAEKSPEERSYQLRFESSDYRTAWITPNTYGNPRVEFKGTLSNDKNSITGTWSVDGNPAFDRRVVFRRLQSNATD